MMREQLLPPNMGRVILSLVVLTLVAAHAPAAIAASSQVKVDRLVMGLIQPYRDYIRPWLPVGTAAHNIQHDPAFEWLWEVDIESGHYKPWLAESWQMAPDGRSWRITLQKGVKFHHGYGEFTAKDVVHTHALWCDDNYRGCEDLPEGGYWGGICQVKRVEMVNDYEVIMRCQVVCADLEFYYSSASNVMMFSKAQWDQEGEMAYETHSAGTGPYIFKERRSGRYGLYERTPTPHWKHGVVDWQELQMTWTYEEPTRLAQLLAGETHLTQLNKDLSDEAVAKGYKLIRSRQVAQQRVIAFGGLYFGTEDSKTQRYTEHGGTTGKLDLRVPWTNLKVRQAMNKAINREELRQVLYKGRANYTYVGGFYPNLPGWDPTWGKRFQEMYGYDVQEAKRLLAEAGYPNGFTAKAWLSPVAGAPDLVPLMESVAVQLREVGIELGIEESDVVTVVHPKVRERRANWHLGASLLAKQAVELPIALFNAGKGLAPWFETDDLYRMWEELRHLSDPAARDAQLRKIGTYKFEHFEIIPLFDVYIEVVVNPAIVDDWPFPGWDGGDLGHTWLIQACKQAKPCQ